MTSMIVLLTLFSSVVANSVFENIEGISHFRKSSNFRPQLTKSNRQVKSDGSESSDRIPRVLKVIHYGLTLATYMEFDGIPDGQRKDWTFDGTVIIHFQITNKTDYFPFRSQKLKIKSYELKLSQTNKIVPILAFKVNEETTEGKLIPALPFEVGKNYSLQITYSGKIIEGKDEETDAGVHYDNYTLPDGTYKQMISTYLEPSNSRKLFPNLDDPFFKASISFTLIYPKQAKVYSNMPKINDGQVYNKYWQKVQFKTSPPMSTYLFAFAIGDFAEAKATTKRGVPIKAVAAKHLYPGLQGSADKVAKCVDAIERLIGIEVPLEKLDNIDVYTMAGLGGGMENFGSIIYSRFLILDPHFATSSTHFSKLSNICHESKTLFSVSHQWFGDMATTDHWGVEFTQESVAVFFQYRAAQLYLDEEDKEVAESQFIQDRETGLEVAKELNHAIVANQSYFDEITYQSGGTVFRMLEAVFGSDVFYKAMQIYLTRNAWKNVDQNSFIDAFEQATNNKALCGSLTIRTVLNDFFLRPHYPVVDISIKNNKYTFHQHSSNPNDKWNLPIFVFDPRIQKSQLIWLLGDSSVCSSNGFKLDPSVNYVFNYRGFSYARIRPSDVLVKALLSLNTSKIDQVTQLSLYYDRLDQDVEMNVGENTNWLSTQMLKKFLQDGKAIGGASPFIVSAYSDIFPEDPLIDYNVIGNVNWTTTSWRRYLYNLNLFSQAVKSYPNLKQEALNLYTQFMIPPNGRLGAFCAGIVDGIPKNVDFFNKYTAAVEQSLEVFPNLIQEFYRFDMVRNACGVSE
ncbi:putative aminopeptidase-2 [Aphelenchoides bicaudatus]|nr:putative aminopeptidase-2 [Aphelenchoides bicaudatus]